VHNIFAVPDYTAWFEGNIDPELSWSVFKLPALCTMRSTNAVYCVYSWNDDANMQLAWKMEAVEQCDDFPLGVRTYYRAYANDSPFKLFRDPDPCSAVGVTAVNTHCRWEPRASPDNHNIGGMYILHHIPRGPLCPAQFLPGARSSAEQSATEFAHLYHTRTDAIQEWQQFLRTAPASDDVWEYVQRPDAGYHVPLQSKLFRWLGKGPVAGPTAGAGTSDLFRAKRARLRPSTEDPTSVFSA
jgi:hypothetical protein